MDTAVAGVGTVPDADDMEAFVVSAGDDTEDAALAVREEGAISTGVHGGHVWLSLAHSAGSSIICVAFTTSIHPQPNYLGFHV
uniref:Uncharacterized protein n=1 Tax=Vitis vinifera TaxID=29760 RepID=A5BT16_VITVI|nr:hypothetical protein VITISV_028481 [Vitis vinifera]